jgi:hypothetical protein
MRRALVFAAALAAQLFATPNTYTYVVATQASLSSAAAVVTIQQPSTGSRQVNFQSAYFDCSVACTMTLETNGTAATTTAGTVSAVNPNQSTQPAAAVTAFTSSNVGTGTVLSKYNCASACAYTIDLSSIQWFGGGTAVNLTLRSNSITGTVSINYKLQEVVNQ